MWVHDLLIATCTSELTPSQVHFAESMQYWTGRYIALSDRLCTDDMKRSTEHEGSRRTRSSSSEDINLSQHGPSESTDGQRMQRVLGELQACCMTNDALKSFQQFDAALKNRSVDTLGVYAVDGGDTWEHAAESNTGLRCPSYEPHVKLEGARKPDSLPRVLGVPSGANAAMSFNTSKFLIRPGLVKSKTTGNLSSTIPPSSNVYLRSAAASTSTAKVTAKAGHSRRPSNLEYTPEMRTKALKDQEARAAKRVTETKRKSSGKITSSDAFITKICTLDKNSGGQPCINKNAGGPAASPYYTTTSENREAFLNSTESDDTITGSRTCVPFETGQNPDPLPPQTAGVGQGSEKIVEMLNGKRVVRSRGRSERQISGEVVKTLFGAGIREVRRMGRRVGSMGWANNEDLSTVIGGAK